MPSFSYSKISSFQKCPRAFEFRYLLGERERFSTIERHMGSSVHEALRWLYMERDAGRRPDRAGLAARYEELWNGPALDNSVVIKARLSAEDYRADGLRMALSYLDGAFPADESETLLLEERFRIDLDGEIRFTGIIDRAARMPDGRLRITDYKTGSRVPEPGADPQLAYYALYLFGEHPDDEIELAYEDLRQGRTLAATLRREECAAYEKRLLDDIGVIEAAESFEARPSVLCHWCGYNPICDAAEKPRKPAGASQAAEAGGRNCPRCQSPLRQRSGKFGTFVGCTGFPGCRYTRDAF